MRYLEKYAATPTEVEELLDLPRLALVAVSDDDGPDVGLFPFLHRGGWIEVHLERSDPQLATIERAGRATVVVTERLSNIPSYWVEADNVLFADALHRTVVVRGRAEVVREPAEIWNHLEALLAKYQPDGPALDPAVSRYHNAADRLALVRVSRDEVRAKLKLGQQEPEALRRRMIEGLHRRGTDEDLRTAELVRRTLTTDDPGR